MLIVTVLSMSKVVFSLYSFYNTLFFQICTCVLLLLLSYRIEALWSTNCWQNVIDKLLLS